MWVDESGLSEKEFFSRLNQLKWALFFSIFVIVFRFFQLQILQGERFRFLSDKNRTYIYFQQAPRGKIFDCNGKILSDSIASYQIFLSKSNMFPQSIKKLSEIIEIDEEKIYTWFAQSRLDLVKLPKDINRGQMLRLEEELHNLPGVNLKIENQRHYPEGRLACHVFGYLGEINREELNNLFREDYKYGDYIGKSGIERVYDRFLRGKDGGLILEVDAHGNQQRVIQNVPSQVGKNVVLTIDSGIQRVTEDAFDGLSGAAVVLRPGTGEILALVSLPSFDPNSFVRTELTDERKKVLSDPRRSLFNRAIQGQYAPGSIFKVITAACALEEGKVDPEERFFCPGYFSLGKNAHIFSCWKKRGMGVFRFFRG